MDGDVIYNNIDIIYEFKKEFKENIDGCITIFEESTQATCYSFVKLNKETNIINTIAEKNRISSFAISGCYGFKSLNKFLNDATNSSLVFKWFQSNKPLTGRGYKYYALAAAKVIKDPQKLSPIIKKGWHKGSFSLPEQKAYQTKFKNYLDIKDHIKKIDNLLFADSTTAAKNNLYLVGADYKKSFEAQIALIQKGSNALGRFGNIPKKNYTPGLIYRYIELKKKNLLNLVLSRTDFFHASADFSQAASA